MIATRFKYCLLVAIFCCTCALAGDGSGLAPFKLIQLAHAPEDLVSIPSSDWVIAGNIVFGPRMTTAGGGLYLINRRSYVATPIEMSKVLVGTPEPEYRDCPGPPSANAFTAHGIELTAMGKDDTRLLVVNHGGRESVEVFRVSAGQAMPKLQWMGCVVFPSHLALNAVASTSDGGFVVTSMLDRDDKDAFHKMATAGITGIVYRWNPGSLPMEMKGTEASVDNGIEVGPDGSIYVAAWGSKEVLRFRRVGDSLVRKSTPVDFLPDNLRWAPDGSLMVAGQRRDLSKINQRCPGGPCRIAWAVARLNPKTMKVKVILEGDGVAFSEATTALVFGNEIWLGSATDHHIAIFHKK